MSPAHTKQNYGNKQPLQKTSFPRPSCTFASMRIPAYICMCVCRYVQTWISQVLHVLMQASKRQLDSRVPIKCIPTESNCSLLLVIGEVICMQWSNLCHSDCFLLRMGLDSLRFSPNREPVPVAELWGCSTSLLHGPTVLQLAGKKARKLMCSWDPGTSNCTGIAGHVSF